MIFSFDASKANIFSFLIDDFTSIKEEFIFFKPSSKL